MTETSTPERVRGYVLRGVVPDRFGGRHASGVIRIVPSGELVRFRGVQPGLVIGQEVEFDAVDRAVPEALSERSKRAFRPGGRSYHRLAHDPKPTGAVWLDWRGSKLGTRLEEGEYKKGLYGYEPKPEPGPDPAWGARR